MDKYNVRLGKDKDIKQRKNLNADALIGLIRSSFKNLKDHRSEKAQIPLADAFLSAFAMFSLKEPSILSFEKRISDANLMTIYKVNKVPCDTQMRTILNEQDPAGIEPLFSDIFCQLQRGKCLEKMVFMDDYYLLSIDATGYFSSNKIHCNS